MTDLKLITEFIENTVKITYGLNKKEELKRLIYEILLINHSTLNDLENNTDIQNFLKKKLSGNQKFIAFKEILLALRYPVASKSEKNFAVYLPRLKFPKQPYLHNLSVPFQPRQIYIQKKAKPFPLTQRVQSLFPDTPVIQFNTLSEIRHSSDSMITDMGKRDLYLVEESFDFIKQCPCTKGALGCNYYILNLGFGCPFDCSYCYLQHYSNTPGILLPVNLKGFFQQAGELLDKAAGAFVRIGTGEFFDSLGLDHITGYSTELVEFFRNRPVLFEFKTKSSNIESLLKIKNPPKNIIVSWSVNPQHIIDSEEYYTASLDERIKAAQTLIAHGYHVGFHFDPIIFYPHWENDYEEVAEKIVKATQGKIAWISIGTLRFYRKLKTVIEQRFPEDQYFYGEFLLDPQDNKMRYPRVTREVIFRKITEILKKLCPEVPVYLCMESPEVWNDVFGHKTNEAEIENKFRRLF